MTLVVKRATLADLDALVPLFDGYRRFYEQTSDPALARDFLAARLVGGESVVFLATRDGGIPAGFAQLYPMFSSVRAARVWVLNDLFVAPESRKRGIARVLLDAAAAFGRSEGAIRLELETTPDNDAAQALYRNAGWRVYDGTLRFHLSLVD